MPGKTYVQTRINGDSVTSSLSRDRACSNACVMSSA